MKVACMRAGLGIVNKLGPNTGSRVEEGQRVVAVPWPTAGGEGTYQQYVAVPEKDLVSMHPCDFSTSGMWPVVHATMAYCFTLCL